MIKISYIFVHSSHCKHTDECFSRHSCHTNICKGCADMVVFQVKRLHIHQLSLDHSSGTISANLRQSSEKGLQTMGGGTESLEIPVHASLSQLKAASALFPGNQSPSSFCCSLSNTGLRSLYFVKHASRGKKKIKASPQRKFMLLLASDFITCI